MAKRIDLIGKTFGSWQVLDYAGYTYTTMWRCRCVCGAERDVSGENLRAGTTTNCGCQRRFVVKHGHARRGKRTRTYRIWKGMLLRGSPHFKQAKDYYDRGIRVCERWQTYENFLADMGECPDGLTLDRVNNNGNYEPMNCRWTTTGVQRRNSRRVTLVQFGGTALHVKDAAVKLGVSDTAIYQERSRNGGTIQEAFDRVAARRA